jgi:hypothetical protein
VVWRLWGEPGRASDGIEPATTAAAPCEHYRHRVARPWSQRPSDLAEPQQQVRTHHRRRREVPAAAGHDVAAPSVAKSDSAMAG